MICQTGILFWDTLLFRTGQRLTIEEIDHLYTRCKHFFISNSFMRNLYWDSQMSKKLLVLKPQRLRNLCFLLFFLFFSIFGYFHLDHSRVPPSTTVSRVQFSYYVEFPQLGARMTFVDTNNYYDSLCCTCSEVCSSMLPLL